MNTKFWQWNILGWTFIGVLLTGFAIIALLSYSPDHGNSYPSLQHVSPILVTSSDVIHVPPPPAEGSATYQQELNEAVALSKDRTPTVEEAAKHWNQGASIRWNSIARDLVAKYRDSSPVA